MSTDFTTLTVSKKLAEKIRSCDGRNTDEKLRNWAEQFKPEYKKLDEDDVREIIRDEVRLEALK